MTTQFVGVEKCWGKKLCHGCGKIGRSFTELQTAWKWNAEMNDNVRYCTVYCKKCLKKWQEANFS